MLSHVSPMLSRTSIAKCQPISLTEFAKVLPMSRPPPGWSETLVVANSGGPDSTCLLFLLSRHIKESPTYFPKRLISFTVDHDLQSSSLAMAKHAASVADSLGVEQVTQKLPWGQHGLPIKPEPGDKIEGVARMMRYKVIFEQLKKLNASSVAFGHHLDDQVETMLMRLGKGSSTYGLAAMRPCRRWGMGNDSDDQYALEGLSKWIVRPLLSFGKDRIIATCSRNNLSYIEDPTNFQPDITLRNAIRYKVCGELEGRSSDEKELSREMVQGLKCIRDAAENAKLDFTLDTPRDQLVQEANRISAKVREQEVQVDELIANCRLSSPPGTFMISGAHLEKVICPNTQDLFLYRISRYVSPEPWGSPRAELGRRKSSVERLRRHISCKSRTSMCVGSHVWWRPLLLFPKSRICTTVEDGQPGGIAWLAQRQPPSAKSVSYLPYFEFDNSQFIEWRDKGADKTVLFDRRFVVRIHVQKIPQNIVLALSLGNKVVIVPSREWCFPEVILRGENTEQLIHSYVIWPYDWRKIFRYRNEEVISGWVQINPIRPISVI